MKRKLEPRFEPDARFLLANERTLLAWTRTAIGLIAGGIVVAHLGGDDTFFQKALAIMIIVVGLLTALLGYSRFKAADKAIRQAKLPAAGYAPRLQLFGIFVITILLIIFVVVN